MYIEEKGQYEVSICMEQDRDLSIKIEQQMSEATLNIADASFKNHLTRSNKQFDVSEAFG